jgi:iron-sulfur cluster repair protein YtfE (RIC family)
MQTTPDTPTGAPHPGGNSAVLAMLAADHDKVRQLAEEYQALLESDEDRAAPLVEDICRELEIHTALEEEVLYPAAARVTELALLIDQAREDHDRVKEIIDEVRSMEPNDPQVAGLVLQLAEDVEAHVSEEEGVLFPELEQRMAAQLDQLGRQMEQLRRRMLQGG